MNIQNKNHSLEAKYEQPSKDHYIRSTANKNLSCLIQRSCDGGSITSDVDSTRYTSAHDFEGIDFMWCPFVNFETFATLSHWLQRVNSSKNSFSSFWNSDVSTFHMITVFLDIICCGATTIKLFLLRSIMTSFAVIRETSSSVMLQSYYFKSYIACCYTKHSHVSLTRTEGHWQMTRELSMRFGRKISFERF